MRFISEIPKWSAQKHGKNIALCIKYTHILNMLSMGKIFKGVSMRYTEYAKQLSPKLGIPVDILYRFHIYFVRATVHYAMFEDEYYLKAEMEALKLSVISVLSKK